MRGTHKDCWQWGLLGKTTFGQRQDWKLHDTFPSSTQKSRLDDDRLWIAQESSKLSFEGMCAGMGRWTTGRACLSQGQGSEVVLILVPGIYLLPSLDWISLQLLSTDLAANCSFLYLDCLTCAMGIRKTCSSFPARETSNYKILESALGIISLYVNVARSVKAQHSPEFKRAFT